MKQMPPDMKHIIILDNVSAKSEVVLLHTNILQAGVTTDLRGSGSFDTTFFRKRFRNLLGNNMKIVHICQSYRKN